MSLHRFRAVACPLGWTPNGGTQLCDPPVGIDPNKNNKSCAAGCNGTDPINSATGALLQTETDYAGDGGLLRLARYYTSVNGQYNQNRLGLQWRTNFDAYIGLVTSGSGSVTTATVYRPDGDRFNFVENAQGQWVPDADVALTLTSTTDSGGNILSWTLIDEEGTKEGYNANGFLVSIVRKDQKQLTLAYSELNLATVIDEHGRSLNFTYGTVTWNGSQTDTRLLIVTEPDGSSINYGYDSSTGLLTTVTYKDASGSNPQTRTYVYGENGAPFQAMTGLIDENLHRYASWAYDSKGRAKLSVHGTTSDYVDRTELTYNTDGTTTITNWIDGDAGVSFTRNFSFDVLYGVAHLAIVGCNGCTSAAIQLPGQIPLPAAASYDSNGFPAAEIDWRGNATAHTYDTTGLETQRIEAQGTSVQRTTNTQWDACCAIRWIARCWMPTTP
ncbi:MAG TPA: DUF6531 domain-containing protein [Rhodanobacteraceae bacterium]|nr:DUF6531 domain-containing protein [Rhodanobacteraceae bacterium]